MVPNFIIDTSWLSARLTVCSVTLSLNCWPKLLTGKWRGPEPENCVMLGTTHFHLVGLKVCNRLLKFSSGHQCPQHSHKPLLTFCVFSKSHHLVGTRLSLDLAYTLHEVSLIQSLSSLIQWWSLLNAYLCQFLKYPCGTLYADYIPKWSFLYCLSLAEALYNLP